MSRSPAPSSPIDWTNANLAWASVLAETLVRLGLRLVAIAPGSRSTPLTVAFARHPVLEAVPVLDERSAGFFALGAARQTHRPVGLVCTSGTAAANFFPAVVEARESGVPLLVLTADRPPELRDCGAGQAIDQVKLYGQYPVWQAELALPEPTSAMLAYLRQTLVAAWTQARRGPVHLNLPFRDPLAPVPEPESGRGRALQKLADRFDADVFFAALPAKADACPLAPGPLPLDRALLADLNQAFARWRACERGAIVAGPAQPAAPARYCEAVARLSRALGWPVLAEGLSPLRNYAQLNPNAIAAYDAILRNPALADRLRPEQVIRLGALPTSKDLRAWLAAADPLQWVLEPGDRNRDPLHGRTATLALGPESLADLDWMPDVGLVPSSLPFPHNNPRARLQGWGKGGAPSPYLQQWQMAETQVQSALGRIFQGEGDDCLAAEAGEAFPGTSGDSPGGDRGFPGDSYELGTVSVEFAAREAARREDSSPKTLRDRWPENVRPVPAQPPEVSAPAPDRRLPPFEGKAAWWLSQCLPPHTPIFIGNSMPVRDVEFFWQPNALEVQPAFNRGANGIDGSLSTALGLAHGNRPAVMLTGDLALLHDTNGFLLRSRLRGHLTIVLMNNNGGGIFEQLPVAAFEPPFEEFFATPQNVDFAQLCATYGVDYCRVEDWETFQALLNPLPETGMRLLEIACDRKRDARRRAAILRAVSSGLL